MVREEQEGVGDPKKACVLGVQGRDAKTMNQRNGCVDGKKWNYE